MSRLVIYVIILAAAVAVFAIIMIILNKKTQKKMDQQQEQIEQFKQQVNILVIDKRKLRLKDANFPEEVLSQLNFINKRVKYPVVKGKVGPRIMTFIAEDKVYDLIPIKTEIKATVSGLYIVDVRGIRTALTSKKKNKKESKIDVLLKKGRGEM